MILRSRWVFPVSSPPIEDGVVVVENDRILFVGAVHELPLQYKSWQQTNLGDAILLPGLVNAHCHLEFSEIPPIPPLQKGGKGGFTEWAREMGRVGAGFPRPGAETAPLQSAIQRLIHTGTTTLADHCNPETEYFETPFRRIVFWEVLGAEKNRALASLEKAGEMMRRHGGYVTPHSLYAVHPEILGRIRDSPLQSIHILESADEDEFFRRGTGPLADYVRERGGDVGANLVFAPTTGLVIHGNYLNSAEIAALRDLNTAVIHCPGSHRFFGHRRFPYEELKKAGITVALGTDSLASNEDLSMLREMRLFRETYPDASEEEILRLATLEGAKALGLEKEVGSIEVGKKADLVAVRGPILETESVIFSMIDGKACLNR